MSAIPSLQYPKKSHRKAVKLPERSSLFAELFGIMMGDGGINNPWQANVTLNSVADAQYALYVADFFLRLFGIVPAARKKKDCQAVVISLASTSVVDFLVEQGLPRGNKIRQGLCIPSWVLENREYRIACVRGPMDTDGCLYIHKHKVLGKIYENITLCFCSASSKLIEQVSEIFVEFGIMPHISRNGRHIYVYRGEAVERYLSLFGTSNDRISSVYERWRVARAV